MYEVKASMIKYTMMLYANADDCKHVGALLVIKLQTLHKVREVMSIGVPVMVHLGGKTKFARILGSCP